MSDDRWRPRRSGQGRAWIAILAVGVLMATLAYVGLPRMWGQSSMQSWIEHGFETGALNAVAGRQIREQVAIQSEVQHMTASQFLVANSSRIKELQAGDTFIPEWRLPANVNPLEYINTPAGRGYQQMALSVLEFEVERLHVYQIRLGIRWSSTITPNGRFSLAFYQPYLNFLTAYRDPTTGARVHLLLGVGPLKSPGWPESFVPQLSSTGSGQRAVFVPVERLPGFGAMIRTNMPGSDLVPKSEVWLNALMWQLSSFYPSINYFQLDNEPRNSAGTRGWVMSSGYEKALAEIVLAYRPDASFLVNWMGTADIAAPTRGSGQSVLGQSLRMANTLTHHSVINEMLSLRRSLLEAIATTHGLGGVTLGVDSYHLLPGDPKLPVTVVVSGHDYHLHLDSLAMIGIAEQLAGDYHPWAKLREMGVPLEITELQAEPWPPFVSPGNNPKELLFEIGRVLQILPRGQTSVVRFWSLSGVIYNLMYDPHLFASNSHQILMRGPTGSFRANNQVELQIVATITGVSPYVIADGHLAVDNSRINSVIDYYLNSRHRVGLGVPEA